MSQTNADAFACAFSVSIDLRIQQELIVPLLDEFRFLLDVSFEPSDITRAFGAALCATFEEHFLRIHELVPRNLFVNGGHAAVYLIQVLRADLHYKGLVQDDPRYREAFEVLLKRFTCEFFLELNIHRIAQSHVPLAQPSGSLLDSILVLYR